MDLSKSRVDGKFSKKELLKPAHPQDELLKEVEFLCPELSSCPKLRNMKDSSGVDVDDDILF